MEGILNEKYKNILFKEPQDRIYSHRSAHHPIPYGNHGWNCLNLFPESFPEVQTEKGSLGNKFPHELCTLQSDI